MAGLLSLQAHAGNRAVGNLVTKLAVQRCGEHACDCGPDEGGRDELGRPVVQRTAATVAPESDTQSSHALDLRPEPTPGHRYLIRKGDTLFGVTSRAFGVPPGAKRLELARVINEHPDNRRFHTDDVSTNERKLFGGSRISFLPRFQVAPDGSGYAVITIPEGTTPPAPTDEPVGPLDEPPTCPDLPNPAGLWMVEPWLHAMRKEPRYSNERLLAPGARGMSVKLVHRVLQHWTCQMSEQGSPPEHRLLNWESEEYTPDTSALVEDFQRHFSAEMVDGIVGPETIALLDAVVGFDPHTPCVDEWHDWHAAAQKVIEAQHEQTMAQTSHAHWEQMRFFYCETPQPPGSDLFPTMCDLAIAMAAQAKEKMENARVRATEAMEEFRKIHEKLIACDVLSPLEKRRGAELIGRSPMESETGT